MKRFYKLVSLDKTPAGWSILLDGKPVRTPSKSLLLARNENLATAIMQEWAAQQEKIIPSNMPLTQILTTKIDRVSAERAVITKALMKYLGTDLLCYRAETPPEVAAAQAQSWDPWLHWFETRFGAALLTTTGLAAIAQPASAPVAVQKYIDTLDDDVFTVLQIVASACGSLVLALAFVEKAITPPAVFAAARVEELYKAALYNEEKYGPDPAQDRKDKAFQEDLQAAEKYLNIIS